MTKTFFDKNELLENLSLANRFTSNKISSAITLQGVLLEGEGKEISIFATNLSSFFNTKLKTKQSQAFRAVIEPKKIIEFLTFLPTGQVELEFKEKKLVITKDKTRGTFPLLDTGDFPRPPNLKAEKKQKIKADFLLKNLPLVLFSASPDDTRPVLTGINFVSQDEDLLAVATDGFRLSLLKTKNQVDFPSMLIPRDFLEEVLKHADEKGEINLTFSTKEKMVLFEIGQMSFYSRLIEGEFPPFEKVLPAESKTRAILDKEEFLQNVKLASVFARDFSNIIICEFKKDGLYIKPKIEGGEENNSYQEIELEGEEQKIAFNFKFVLDLLNHTSAKKVTVEILRPDAPAVFKLGDNKEFLHIIMPVRIQS